MSSTQGWRARLRDRLYFALECPRRHVRACLAVLGYCDLNRIPKSKRRPGVYYNVEPGLQTRKSFFPF